MRHFPIRIFAALGSFLLLAGQTLAQTDDSVWINAQIQAAIQAGRNSYFLPAGVYNLEKQIVIPAGTKNFTLSGAGPEETLLRTPTVRIKQAIRVGIEGQNHSKWGLRNVPNTAVFPVSEGSTTIRLDPSEPPIAPGIYYLHDESRVRHTDTVSTGYNHGELVRVTRYNGVSHSVSVQVPLGRDYDFAPVKLAYVEPQVCQNITVEGIGFDGLTAGGQGSYGLVYACLVEGLICRNVKVRNFFTGGIFTLWCNNTLVENADIADGVSGGAGEGYAIYFAQSRFATVRNTRAANCRHGFLVHTGTMDVLFDNCVGERASFDTHGFDERRITFYRCTGLSTGVDIGNAAWLAGGKDIKLIESRFDYAIKLYANTRGTEIIKCSFRQLTVRSDANRVGAIPTGGIVESAKIVDSELISGEWCLNSFRTINCGTITFQNCLLRNTNASWGRIIELTEGAGTLNFIGCRFVNDSTYVPIRVSTTQGLTLNIQNTTFRSQGGGQGAIQFLGTYNGRFSLMNNRFETTRSAQATPLARFLFNDANATGVEYNSEVVFQVQAADNLGQVVVSRQDAAPIVPTSSSPGGTTIPLTNEQRQTLLANLQRLRQLRAKISAGQTRLQPTGPNWLSQIGRVWPAR